VNNRFHNARNDAQGNFKRVLCVCSAGLLRSPTVAWVLSNEPFNFNTRAAGSSVSFALVPGDEVMLHWADVVVFVNKENEEEVQFRFKDKDFLFDNKHLITLNIPDNFQFRDPKLVEIIKEQLIKAAEEVEKQTGDKLVGTCW